MSKEKLSELNKSNKKSSWLNDALYRKENKKWLNYSSQIARRILAKIDDDKDLSQVEISRRLNVSPQQVNKIVKGYENLTLETIAKLSDVTGVELISFPEYKYSHSNISMSSANLIVNIKGLVGMSGNNEGFISTSYFEKSSPVIPLYLDTLAVSNGF